MHVTSWPPAAIAAMYFDEQMPSDVTSANTRLAAIRIFISTGGQIRVARAPANSAAGSGDIDQSRADTIRRAAEPSPYGLHGLAIRPYGALLFWSSRARSTIAAVSVPSRRGSSA